MAQNYDFLRAHWPKLAALASDAMRLVDISPSVSLSSMRTFCEWASGIILEMKGMPAAENTDAYAREAALFAISTIPQNVKDAFKAIDNAPSRMRGPLGDPEVSRECLEQLDVIAEWMAAEAGASAPIPSQTPSRYAASSAIPRKTSFGVQAEAADARDFTGRSSYYAPREDEHQQEDRPFYADSDEDEYGDGDEGISPYGGTGRPSQLSGPRIKNPLVLLIPIVIVCILIVILAISLLTKGTGSNARVTPAPTAPTLATMPPTPTPLPTESPTPAPAVITYLQDLTWSDSGFAAGNVHLGQWNVEGQGQFQIEDVTYERGMGMFISSKDITATRATRTITYDLKGMYSTLMFDLGPDKNWCYGSQAEYGSYRLVVRIDGVAIWDSGGLAATDGARMNNSLPITGAQTMVLELTQRKGTKGTLNIVLGNIRLESNGVGAYAATVPPAATLDPESTETMTSSETPAP